MLHPGLIVSAAPELPPPPEDYVPRKFVPLLDTPNSDMHPYMESVADLINEVRFKDLTGIFSSIYFDSSLAFLVIRDCPRLSLFTQQIPGPVMFDRVNIFFFA